ncbi:MAG TPA: hypothetical protein VF657_15720 [Actinoplanes sp.]
MTGPLDDVARRAADEARRAQETLREAYGCLSDAVDQVRRTVAGSGNPLPAAAVERCLGALALTSQLSGLVDGIAADSRRRAQASLLPDVVVPLHEALGRVHQCAASVRALRLDAERTERRVRRGAGDDPLLTAVAARWGVAARRLDGLVARLEAGARALDAYLDGVVFGTDHGAVRRTRLAKVLVTVREPGADAAADAARVVRLVALAEPDRVRRRNAAAGELWTRPWRR